jgi:hypothetical protein
MITSGLFGEGDSNGEMTSKILAEIELNNPYPFPLIIDNKAITKDSSVPWLYKKNPF